MAVPARYQQKDAWPHVFVRTDRVKQLPPKSMFLVVPGPTHAVLHYCRECHKEWWYGEQPRPIEACPARTDKKEIRRLLG